MSLQKLKKRLTYLKESLDESVQYVEKCDINRKVPTLCYILIVNIKIEVMGAYIRYYENGEEELCTKVLNDMYHLMMKAPPPIEDLENTIRFISKRRAYSDMLQLDSSDSITKHYHKHIKKPII